MSNRPHTPYEQTCLTLTNEIAVALLNQITHSAEHLIANGLTPTDAATVLSCATLTAAIALRRSTEGSGLDLGGDTETRRLFEHTLNLPQRVVERDADGKLGNSHSIN